jgi:3-(3-hydroxy-phenyl)propionate hydroxylase
MLPQGLVRSPDGRTLASDDALGDQLTLLGLGKDPRGYLSAGAVRAWTARGGGVAQFCQRGEALNRSGGAFEALDNVVLGAGAPFGWCVVVRPDRTIMAEGPIEAADSLVWRALRLLGAEVSESRSAAAA